jgi:DNA primase
VARFDRDEVLARTELPSLLDELCGPREGEGRRARWHCPMPDHPDANPSVTVGFDRRGVQRWRCWSEGHGGTAIDALVARRGLSVRESIEALAERTGVVGDRPLTPRVERPPTPPRAPTGLSDAAMLYALTCQSALWKPLGEQVLEYLVAERGLELEVLKLNRVGADPGFSVVAKRAGLPPGGPRAVFPVLTDDMHVRYFQVRTINPAPGQSKYLNPPRAHGGNPGYGWTVPVSPAAEPVVICEGLPDAYIANSAGYPAVAVLGTGNATPALADKLAPDIGNRPVILAFDGDDAGRAAATNLGSALWRRGIMVVDLRLPSGADLNSWVHSARQLVPRLGVHPPTRPAEPAAPAPAIPAP